MPKTGIGSLTPAEIADRCERWYGARVVRPGEDGSDRYKVYPPDPSHRPIFYARKLHSGPEIPNIVNTLRKAGMDILAEPDKEDPPVPTPADIAAKVRTNGAPVTTPKATPDYDTLIEMLAGAERRVDRVQENLLAEVEIRRELQERVERLETEARAFPQVVRSLVERIEQLESGGHSRGPTTIEIVREKVLEFLKARPGEKWSPQMIEMNLGDQLPEARNKTAVANACKDLAELGRLQGGGTNKKGASQATRGIYWYEPEEVS